MSPRASLSSNSPLPTWIAVWFSLSSILVLWDAGFLLVRPRGFPGGDLSWIWEPYSLYSTIDLVYSRAHWTAHDGFPASQAAMNLIETALNYAYVYLAHISPSPIAPVIGLTAATMTWSKTSLYALLDYNCGPNGWCTSGHNDMQTWLTLYVAPNRPWIVIPFLIMLSLGSRISQDLRALHSMRAPLTKAHAD
ncbi:hypothetical protein DL93DRAFT_2078415 [Clavulina sp. PMI_390]|nr:hypothetical protein DL93DRAFT_2078415 [Clavulina sp. PMI_390]